MNWSFRNPFSIDNNYLKNIYGNVNSNDNYGWNWTNFDKNYYASPP